MRKVAEFTLCIAKMSDTLNSRKNQLTKICIIVHEFCKFFALFNLSVSSFKNQLYPYPNLNPYLETHVYSFQRLMAPQLLQDLSFQHPLGGLLVYLHPLIPSSYDLSLTFCCQHLHHLHTDLNKTEQLLRTSLM